MPKRRACLQTEQTESQGQQVADKLPASEELAKVENETFSYNLSDEVDENGRQFVLNSNGDIVFGQIEAETGLQEDPILLSEGIITNPSTNAGYGLVHIEARHGDQIRAAGYKSVIEFIEEVTKKYEVIREGNNRDGHQTYMLQLTDKHNNTLMVELSGDGTYWNINTAGIFKTSYEKNRKEVYNRHTTVKQSTEIAEESQSDEQSGTQTPSRMNTPTQPSTDKGSEVSVNNKENSEKVEEGKAESNATPTDEPKGAKVPHSYEAQKIELLAGTLAQPEYGSNPNTNNSISLAKLLKNVEKSYYNLKIASYQRFFTPSELKAWVESELGDGYSVEVANEKNLGTKGLAAVVVTKNNESLTMVRPPSRSAHFHPHGNGECVRD